MTLVIIIFVIEFSVVLCFLILLKKYVFSRKKKQPKN
jgi:preprotein translocase subunit SecG